MTLQIVFWVLMLIWLFSDLRAGYVQGQPYPIYRGVNTLLIFVLLGILGWACAHLLSALP